MINIFGDRESGATGARGPVGPRGSKGTKVDCGKSGTNSVIHCDRMRKRKSQILTMEDDTQDDTLSDQEQIEMIETNEDIVENLPGSLRSRRNIRRPAYLQDYECD